MSTSKFSTYILTALLFVSAFVFSETTKAQDFPGTEATKVFALSKAEAQKKILTHAVATPHQEIVDERIFSDGRDDKTHDRQAVGAAAKPDPTEQRTGPYLHHKVGKQNLLAGPQRLYLVLCHSPDHQPLGHTPSHKRHKRTFS